jgi:hypothetical protein
MPLCSEKTRERALGTYELVKWTGSSEETSLMIKNKFPCDDDDVAACN